MEEFENIAKLQPVFAGDVISHSAVRRLSVFGLVTRDSSGEYILTKKGSDLWEYVKCLSLQKIPFTVFSYEEDKDETIEQGV